MTSTFPYGRSKTVLRLNPGRLWAGGVATAVIAALIVIVGISIARGIFGVPMPVPAPNGGMSAIAYVGIAAGAAIVATALLHLLIVGAPRPLAFFAWIVFLATVLGVLADRGNQGLDRVRRAADSSVGGTQEEIALAVLAEIVAERQARQPIFQIALPATAIDPICGMTVEIKGAMHTLAMGETSYYFCSAGCTDAFRVREGQASRSSRNDA